MRPPERSVELTQVTEWNGGNVRSVQDSLAAEEPLEIRVAGTPLTVTMRTPGHDLELAAGFLSTEGIIASENRSYGSTPLLIKTERRAMLSIELKDTCFDADDLRRNSLCRIELRTERPRSRPSGGEGCRTPTAHFGSTPNCQQPAGTTKAEQTVFGRTGGLHAAALFDAAGTLVVLREDIGRHNAVDKAIGWPCWKDDCLNAHVMLVSGRADRDSSKGSGQIPILASVSAPSSLAVKLARELGLTLVGFLRGRRFVVYSGGFRCLPADGRDVI
jgi:FdhD protein